MQEYNIYCDESCHLEKHDDPCMAFAGIKCEKSKIKEKIEFIKAIKKNLGFQNIRN